MSAANSLGYVASAAASELARGRGSQEANVPRGTILVVLGPAAGQPEQTGNSASDIEQLVQSVAWTHGFSVSLETCDNAGTVGAVRAAAASAAGIIVTSDGLECPAAVGLHDALASTMVPSVEIRRGMSPCLEHSSACTVVISGAGNLGYKLAVEYLAGSGIPAP
jgi:3-dehydroquinate dehydratase-2